MEKDLSVNCTSSSKDNSSSRRTLHVAVEGNIGSGKSTLLDHFKNSQDIEISPEPVQKWCDLEGHNLLGQLYQDASRWSFQFQSYVQLTRLELFRQQSDAKVKILERSLQNNRYCFLELGRKNGDLTKEEIAVLHAWHDWMKDSMDLSLDFIVYLRTSPQIVHERMRKRNREEESGVPLTYLTHLHEAYEDWLVHQKFEKMETPILIVNADRSMEEMKEIYSNIEAVIRGEVDLGGRTGILDYDEDLVKSGLLSRKGTKSQVVITNDENQPMNVA